MTNTVQTLDSALVALVESTVALAEKGGAFITAEAPEVVSQLLRWKFVESLCGFVIGLLLLALSVMCVRYLTTYKKKHETYLFDNDGLPNSAGIPLSIIYLALSVVIGPCVIFTNTAWLQIAIAPKLYLLEYAAELMK